MIENMDNSAPLNKLEEDIQQLNQDNQEIVNELQNNVEEADAEAEVAYADAEEVQDIAEAEAEESEEAEGEEASDASVDDTITDIDSVQIAPTNIPLGLEDENSLLLFIQLGDRVIVDSKKYGRTIGTVYYRSLEYIRVKPDGVSNTLHTFELEQTDEEELYKEEDGVNSIAVIEKRKFESFVEQQDFRINQIIDTFTSEGESYKSYKIIEVDTENDNITIQDVDDPELTQLLQFNFIGIESDEDFLVISIRIFVGDDETNVHNDAPVNVSEKDEDEDEEEEEEAPLNIKIVSFIEITKPKVYREAESYEQQIPDNLQKIDALNDFISGLDPSLQKDAKALRYVRILVETLFNLKQLSIVYNNDGSIQGPAVVSVSNLKDLIENTHVPLGRPVLSVSKKLYNPDDDSKDDNIHFVNFDDELKIMIENKSTMASSYVKGSSIIKEWEDQSLYLKQYCSTWKTNEKHNPIWKPLMDSDFFREAPPEIEENQFLSTIPGYVPSYDEEHPPVFDTIPFGIERALSITYRKSKNRRKETLLPEEDATLTSYLLFPIKTKNYLGKTRSTSLAQDSGRSQMPLKTMKMILEKTGGPKELGTSHDIILLGVSNNTLGNIPIADYMEGISIPALGLGDTFAVLEQYGMNNVELNYDISNVLYKKIRLYQSQLISSLTTLRTLISSNSNNEIKQNPFIENPAFLENIRTQSILANALVEYNRINPTLSSSDIGIVSYLMQTHPTYFQIAVGNNSVLIAKATLFAQRMEYIKQLHIAKTVRYNELHKHIIPPRNKCTHVADFVSIKKIHDDNERFQELTNFFRKYQGGRDQNWINCNVCKEHLLCMHERLQLQAYLNQPEKESIDKEIILMFSGGQFQGKYICRNCGQAIKELDFDNNIEFDDNGKPKSGRAVLVDEDALFEEKLDLMISPQIDQSPQNIKLNEEEMKCYRIIHDISTLIGIYMDTNTFTHIIARVLKYMNSIDPMDVYNKKRELNPRMTEYNIALSRFIIISSCIYLLIEIQTKIPSYVARYSFLTCESPGFNGYPLDPDTSKLQGIKYMACAIISFINKDEYPWNQTGFNKIAEDKLQKGILTLLFGFINENVVKDNVIQSELGEKRHYLLNVLGKTLDGHGDIIKDSIPASFLPEQIKMAPEVAAENVITPEVAALMQNTGILALSKLWIRHAHVLAKNNAILIRGSPFMETSCCSSTIENPGRFWHEADVLPQLNKRYLVPNKQGQFLIPNYIPREAGSNVTEPNKEFFYRLFLKYCFQGSRIGHLHEPGLSHKCTWCGFQFPTYPAVMDTDTEGKAALISQNVKTDTEEFTKLLDTIHDVNAVQPVAIFAENTIQNIMIDFSNISVPPIQDWVKILMDTTQLLLSLPPNPEISEIVNAVGPISNITKSSQQIVDKLLSESHRKIIKSISELSWMNFFQVIQNYFLVSFQRIITNFTTESLRVPIELIQSLSAAHVNKDILPILENDITILSKKDNIQKASIAEEKLKYFIMQISALLPYKNKLRLNRVPGKEITLKYIQRALLYGPIASLLNQNELPPNMNTLPPMKTAGDKSVKKLVELLSSTLDKYNREKLSFNDEEIKNLIAIRDEKERVNVVAEFNKLTDEERAMELMNKRLGLGKWAVGGTKLIYAYDKDYYDIERQKRLDAGIIDFPGNGNGELGVPQGKEMDDFGFPVLNDMDLELDGGYDHNQQNDDNE